MRKFENLYNYFVTEFANESAPSLMYVEFLNEIMNVCLREKDAVTDSRNWKLYVKCLDYMLSTGEECFAALWERFSANDRSGQFFTPSEVCDTMAEMLFNEDDFEKYTSRKPMIISEPAAGGGKTLLGCVKKIPSYCMHKVCFHAIELDKNAAVCCALNLLHANANAYIVIGDTLNMKAHGGFMTVHDIAIGGIVCRISEDVAQNVMKCCFMNGGER